MNCSETRHLLASYVPGDIEEAARAAVERHLAECPACRIAADEARATIRVLASALDATRPADRTLSRERRREILESAPAPVRWEWIVRPHRAVAVAASFLLMCTFVVMLLRRIEHSRPARDESLCPVVEKADEETGVSKWAAAAPKPPSAATPESSVPAEPEAVLSADVAPPARPGNAVIEGRNGIAARLARTKMRSQEIAGDLPGEQSLRQDKTSAEETAAPVWEKDGSRTQAGESLGSDMDVDGVSPVAAFAPDSKAADRVPSPFATERKLSAASGAAAQPAVRDRRVHPSTAPSPVPLDTGLVAGAPLIGQGAIVGDAGVANSAPAGSTKKQKELEIVPKKTESLLKEKTLAAKTTEPVINVEIEGSLSPGDQGRRLIRVRLIGDPGDSQVVLVSKGGPIWRIHSADDSLRDGERGESGRRAAPAAGVTTQSAWFEIELKPNTPDSSLIAEVCLRSGTGERVLHRIYARDVAPAFEAAAAGYRAEASAVVGRLAPDGARMPVLSKAALEADINAAATETSGPVPIPDVE